jgi:hypothetical protein
MLGTHCSFLGGAIVWRTKHMEKMRVLVVGRSAFSIVSVNLAPEPRKRLFIGSLERPSM